MLISTYFLLKRPICIELSKYYPKNFGMCGKKQSPASIHEKNPNTLNYLIFLWILQKHRIFCHFFIFQKIWQCLTLCSCQGYRLIIAGCIKVTMFKKNTKIQTPGTIWFVFVTCSHKKVPEESDSSRCLDFFMDTARSVSS